MNTHQNETRDYRRGVQGRPIEYDHDTRPALYVGPDSAVLCAIPSGSGWPSNCFPISGKQTKHGTVINLRRLERDLRPGGILALIVERLSPQLNSPRGKDGEYSFCDHCELDDEGERLLETLDDWLRRDYVPA